MRSGLAPPLDQLFELAHHAVAADGGVHGDVQGFAVVIVDDVEGAVLAAIGQGLVHEVLLQVMFGAIGSTIGSFTRGQAVLHLAAQVQPKDAVESPGAFTVDRQPFHAQQSVNLQHAPTRVGSGQSTQAVHGLMVSWRRCR